MGLEGKVALITGSSRGLGSAIAVELAKRGVKVAITFRKEADKAEKVRRVIASFGSAIVLNLDVSNRDSIKEQLNKLIGVFGEVDILVNNAAIAQEKPFGEISDEDWDNMLKINLRGPFICSQEVLPYMVKQNWGRIVNIVSIGGQWGGFNQVHYAAAKAGLINLTKSMAKLYSKYGITTNAVSPGLIETDMTERELNSEAGKEKVKNIPIGRIATPEEVANAVTFLCSDEASYITGQTINVNGGMYFS